jgi:predicted Na+-dependent transporter
MSDKALLVVLLYLLFTFALGVFIGKMLKMRDNEPSIWKDMKDE